MKNQIYTFSASSRRRFLVTIEADCVANAKREFYEGNWIRVVGSDWHEEEFELLGLRKVEDKPDD